MTLDRCRFFVTALVGALAITLAVAGLSAIQPSAQPSATPESATWTLWEIYERWARREDKRSEPGERHLTVLHGELDRTACGALAVTKIRAVHDNVSGLKRTPVADGVLYMTEQEHYSVKYVCRPTGETP